MHTQPNFCSSTNAMNSLRFSLEAKGQGPYLVPTSQSPFNLILFLHQSGFEDGMEKMNFLKEKTQINEERKATKRRMQERKGKVESREAWAPLKGKGQMKDTKNSDHYLNPIPSPFHRRPSVRHKVWLRTLKHSRLGLNKFIMTQVITEHQRLEKIFQARLAHACLCWQCSFPHLRGHDF